MNRASPAPSRLRSILLTLLLGSLQALMPLSTDLYLPALPTIAHDLNVDPGATQLTLAVFLTGVALGQLVCGPLADMFGRKKSLLVGLALYLLGTAICVLAPTITMLMCGRFVQALGVSASAVVTIAIARDLWSGTVLAERLSFLFLVIGVAPILAPSFGGLLLSQWNWRSLFLCLGIFGLLLALSVTMLPETAALNTRTQARLWNAAAAYVTLLNNIPFLLYILTGGCLAGTLLAYITGSSFIYITMLGVSPGLFAILLGVNATGFIGATQLNRVLLRRWSITTIAWATVIATFVFTLLLLALVASGLANIVTLTVFLWLLSAGLGCAFPNIPALALGTVRERIGSAAALHGTAQSIFGGIAGALVGGLGNGATLPVVGIMASFATLAGVFLIGEHRMRTGQIGL